MDRRTSRVIYNEPKVDDFVPAAQEAVPPPNDIFEDVREDELLELEEVLKGHALEEPPPRSRARTLFWIRMHRMIPRTREAGIRMKKWLSSGSFWFSVTLGLD